MQGTSNMPFLVLGILFTKMQQFQMYSDFFFLIQATAKKHGVKTMWVQEGVCCSWYATPGMFFAY